MVVVRELYIYYNNPVGMDHRIKYENDRKYKREWKSTRNIKGEIIEINDWFDVKNEGEGKPEKFYFFLFLEQMVENHHCFFFFDGCQF